MGMLSQKELAGRLTCFYYCSKLRKKRHFFNFCQFFGSTAMPVCPYREAIGVLLTGDYPVRDV